MYIKSIKRNLKLITSINNISLFLDSTQSNFNSEASFAAIREVLREIRLFEHYFELEILAKLKSKREGRNNEV